jgi:hypothetical protein
MVAKTREMGGQFCKYEQGAWFELEPLCAQAQCNVPRYAASIPIICQGQDYPSQGSNQAKEDTVQTAAHHKNRTPDDSSTTSTECSDPCGIPQVRLLAGSQLLWHWCLLGLMECMHARNETIITSVKFWTWYFFYCWCSQCMVCRCW